jgi:polar amino acid transport system substrate-binding protein
MAIPDSVLAELAPIGTLRAAVNGSNAALVRIDDRTGVPSGPSVDLASALADEVGCPLSIVKYASAAAILASAERNEWDIALIAADPSRTDRFAFSPPYTFVTATYLVPEMSDAKSVADMDVSGRRIGAARGAAYTKEIERQVKHATIVYVETPSAAVEMLRAGGSDAAAGLRQSLEPTALGDPAFRTLPDAFSEIPQTVAVLKDNKAAAAFVAKFVESYLGRGSLQ